LLRCYVMEFSLVVIAFKRNKIIPVKHERNTESTHIIINTIIKTGSIIVDAIISEYRLPRACDREKNDALNTLRVN